MPVAAFLLRYWKQAIGLAAVISLAYGVVHAIQKFRSEKQRRVVAELQLEGQREIAQDLQARLTLGDIARDSVGQALIAEKQLNGKLRAALTAHVAARDTVLVERPLETDTTDQTRTAHFRDSTFAGVISGTVVAPPFPSPLRIGYQVSRPEFNPTIAFVQVGERMVATVYWQDEHVEVQAPYWKPEAYTSPIQLFVEGGYGNNGLGGRAGPLWNLRKDLQLEGFVGYEGEFRTGVDLRGTFNLHGR